MARRTYGQFGGLGHALEIVGERWALLIIRDLVVGPKRFTDLRDGLPRIPTNVLSARLRELEEAGVVQRRALPRPASGVVYELTPYGSELEPVVVSLDRWGSQTLPPECGPDQVVSVQSLVLSLRSMFHPEAAAGVTVTYELWWDQLRVHARIVDGVLEAGVGSLPEADLVIEASFATHALMTGEITPAEAINNDRITLTGDPTLLELYVKIFHL